MFAYYQYKKYRQPIQISAITKKLMSYFQKKEKIFIILSLSKICCKNPPITQEDYACTNVRRTFPNYWPSSLLYFLYFFQKIMSSFSSSSFGDIEEMLEMFLDDFEKLSSEINEVNFKTVLSRFTIVKLS